MTQNDIIDYLAKEIGEDIATEIVIDVLDILSFSGKTFFEPPEVYQIGLTIAALQLDVLRHDPSPLVQKLTEQIELVVENAL
jgi:hypothetical protein